MRRRLRRLFGTLWLEHLEVFPYDPGDPIASLMRATVREYRDAGGDGRGRRLTDGEVHRTLSGQHRGITAEELDRQLRRLAGCW